MNATYERLINQLDEREIRYRANTDNLSICADFRGDVGTYQIVARVEEGRWGQVPPLIMARADHW
jgi:hypothetical protein